MALHVTSNLAPGDTKKILIGVAAIMLFTFGISGYFLFWPEYERSELLKNGVPANGEIVSIEPTGNIYNDQPQARIAVKVVTDSGEAFVATTTMIINPLYAPQFQPGKKVKVRYDANDRAKMAIEETEAGQR